MSKPLQVHNEKRGTQHVRIKLKIIQYNVEEATKLYSQAQEETELVYPSYEKSKKRFDTAHVEFKTCVPDLSAIDEHSPLEHRVEFVKAFQELNNAFEALVTYDDYNDEMEQSDVLQEQVKTLEEYIGVYNTVKGSLINEPPEEGEREDFSEIEFYGNNTTKLYDIDSAYIDQLLEVYAVTEDKESARQELVRALHKMDKPEAVKNIYYNMLNEIDNRLVPPDEDILALKRQYFTDASNAAIEELSNTWFVNEEQLQLSARQYVPGSKDIPNISGILNSKQFDKYKELNPNAKPFSYSPQMKKQWLKTSQDEIVPYGEELR